MGRVKIAKKSTFIDMTAMSDVTVLLLTFFMLTSTFLSKEPAKVVTPPSVSTEKVQETNVVQVLVNPEGKVWLTMNNDTSANWSNEKMRVALLDKVSEIYNETHKNKPVKFTEQQKYTFSKLGSFGVPLAKMGEYLDLIDQPEGQTKMDKWLEGDGDPNHPTGIPISWNQNESNPNEFQMWMKAMRQSSNENLVSAIKDGTGVAIKADQNTSFDVVHLVMDNLQTIHMNKFTLLTALKGADPRGFHADGRHEHVAYHFLHALYDYDQISDTDNSASVERESR